MQYLDTLKTLFSDIASALRERNVLATSDPIKAEDFPEYLSTMEPFITREGITPGLIDKTLSAYYNPSVSTLTTQLLSQAPNLRTVVLPNCSSVQASAFYNCPNLQTIMLANCTSLGSYACYSDSNLTTFYAPNLTVLRGSAFYGCRNLSSISVGKLTSIGDYAIYMTSITDLDLTELQYIGYRGLYGTYLTKIDAPNLTSMGTEAFLWGDISYFSAPQLSILPASAFGYCKSLISVYAPAVTSIGSNCFEETPMSIFDFPNLISLSSYWRKSSGYTDYSYPKCQRLYMPKLSRIYTSTFYGISGCSDFTINFSAITSIPQSCFMGVISSENLSDFINVSIIGSSAFYGCSIGSANFPKLTSIGSMGLYQVKPLSYINMPSITTLGTNAIGGDSASLRLLGSYSWAKLTRIYSHGLADCGMTELSLANIQYLDAYAIAYMPLLSKLYLKNARSQIIISSGAFYYCSALKDLYIDSPYMAKLDSRSAFYHVYGCCVHVPSNLLATYQANSSWNNTIYSWSTF